MAAAPSGPALRWAGDAAAAPGAGGQAGGLPQRRRPGPPGWEAAQRSVQEGGADGINVHSVLLWKSHSVWKEAVKTPFHAPRAFSQVRVCSQAPSPSLSLFLNKNGKLLFTLCDFPVSLKVKPVSLETHSRWDQRLL